MRTLPSRIWSWSPMLPRGASEGFVDYEAKPWATFYSHLPDELLAKFGAERGQSKHNTLWEGLALLVPFRL